MLLSLAGSALGQEKLTPEFHQKVNLSSPNPLLAVDLVHTRSPELILSDVESKLRVYNSEDGEEIRSISLEGGWLTAPVVGDFAGQDRLDIALGTGNGHVVILDGRTLEKKAEAKIGGAFNVQPTVFTMENAEGGPRDRVIIVDQDGKVYAVDYRAPGELEVAWEYSSGTKIHSPMVVGRVRFTDQQDIVATSNEGHVFLIDPVRGSQGSAGVTRILIQQTTPIPVSPLVYDLAGDSRDEVVITMKGGEVRCFAYRAGLVPPMETLWRRALPTGPVSPPVLLAKDGEPGSEVILQLSEASIQVLDARSGEIVRQDLSNFSGISTQAALIPQIGRYPEAVFGLKKTLQVTRNMTEWIENDASLESKEGSLSHELSHAVAAVMPGGQGEPIVLFGLSPQEGGHLYSFQSGLTATWPTLSPWMTQGGTPYHRPYLDRQWASHESRVRDALQRRAQGWNEDLQSAMEISDWSAATEAAVNLVTYDPYNPDYRSLRWEIWYKKHFLKIMVVLISAIIIGGFSIYKIVQAVNSRGIRKRAEAAFERGEYDEARRYYARLLAKRPRNSRVAYALARVLIAQHDFSEETLEVYRKAYAAHPEDAEVLAAFARALLLEPKTDEEAEQIYERAMPSFPEPALLEYGIGRCLMAGGNYEEAGKRLRSALRGGVATEPLYGALCDVYLQTGNVTAKALPVFQQQFASRRNEPEFLKAYLSACIDAKKMDQPVESLCQAVLEHVPGHIPAYLHLARIQMQKKQMGAAIDEIRSALEIEPDNGEAMLLLAQCFKAQNRRDDEALQTYLRALGFEPGNAEFLRNVASIYFERGQFDQDAVQIYRASYQYNPNDATTLKALARTAELAQDHALAIEALETLSRLGQMTPEYTIQLADAYVKKGVSEAKTEKVFQEALRQRPEKAEYTGALASVLMRQDRTTAESIPVYEKHLANQPKDLEVGRQLAKTYIAADRYEQALKTAQRFLQQDPEDEELQRLNALASLYDNKIDEAVQEYRRILERNADDKEALVNLALAYGQKLRTDEEATELYERALAMEPDNDMLHLAMARVHGSQNDGQKAVSSYRQALKCQENNEQKVIAHLLNLLSEIPALLRIRWFLVELLVSYGHFREALEQIDFIAQKHPGQGDNTLRALETILKKDPKNVTALAQRGAMLLAAGRTEEAVRALEKAQKLQPAAPDVQEKLIQAYRELLEKKDSPEFRFKLGKIYYSQQEYDEAIGCFQKTAQDYRWEAESTKMLGKCFTGKGMLDLALQEFKKLVVDDETKELLYDLAQRYETKKDLVGAKTVYRQLFAADIGYKDVKTRFEMLSGSTSDPMAFEKTAIVQQMSEEAARRYELLDELGRGAMGIVYRARDKELEEIVALKILPDNMSNNPEAVRRFKVEARNARKLSHPNIVRIHDIGEEMGRKYISMEYVDGTDLKRKIKSNPEVRLPHDQIVRYAMETADALGYAHRLQIVHRDIKPANIMLNSNDEVKVTDFGIAKMMDSTGEGTMIGAVIGTPLYMSPEQVQGHPVDNRADIYSLGILLYELFNGRPPFTEGDLAYQHLHKDPEPIHGIPEKLWEIVSKCLEKKKEDRWEKAEDIYNAFREYQQSATGSKA